MKRLFLWLLCAVASDAQSISITKPAANDAITYDPTTPYYFTVSYSGADITYVQYTCDSHPCYNPGTDAASALGMSLQPPFSFQYNSTWNLNGPHQVVATAYNALGAAIATSAAVAYTSANNWPMAFSPTMTVATTCPANPCTVTPTMGVAGTIPGDSLTYTAFIDGIQQASGGFTSTSPGAITLYSTQFQNGPHNVCVEVTDNTSKPVYGGAISTDTGAATEWCRTMTFANGAVPSQALLNAHEIFLAAGAPAGGDCLTGAPVSGGPYGSCKLTAVLQNTDGSSTASTPVFMEAPYYNQGPLQSEGNLFPFPTGSSFLSYMNANAASINSSTGVITALNNGVTMVEAMTPTITYTDLAVTALSACVTSAAFPFTPLQTGWMLNITSSTGGWSAGQYHIYFVSGGCAFLTQVLGGPYGPQWSGNPYPTATGSSATGGHGTSGPTRQAYVYVWPSNSMGCFGQDGAIQASYTPNCYFPAVMMGDYDANTSSLQVMQNDQPYNSAAAIGCPAAWTASYPCGPAVDFGISGFNTFEFGGFGLGSVTGSESAATFQTNTNNIITAAETNGLNLYSKFRGIDLLASFLNGPAELWGVTYGNEGSGTYIGSQTGFQWYVSRQMAAGNIIGGSSVDEIQSHWGAGPLQGPLSPTASGSTQSPITSIVASSGVCSVNFNTSPAAPIIYTAATGQFTITGDTTGSGLNNVYPATWTAPLSTPSGASATASGSGSSLSFTITGGGSHYYAPPFIQLVGGGGTYTNALASVSGGALTGIIVTGASGYSYPPLVYIRPANSYFTCTGVTNGTYDVNTDPGVTIQPYGIWINSNTSAPYDMWGKFWQQINAMSNRKYWITNPNIGLGSAPQQAAWNNGPTYPLLRNAAQTLYGATGVADAGMLYFPSQDVPYIMSRKSANSLVAPLNGGFHFRALYGAYNPSLPYLAQTQGTSGYAGLAGYPVTVTSCSGNTITFSGPHGITNIVPGLTRLVVSGATDGSAVDTCNQAFTALASPTPNTLTVLLAATDFAAGSSDLGTSFASLGTATFADSTVFTIQAPSGTTCNPVCISAKGTPNQAGSSSGYNLGGDFMVPSTSTSYARQRGQTFTLSGVSVSLEGTVAGPYTFTGSNNVLTMTINGGSPQSVTLSSGTLAASTVASAINAAITGVTAAPAGTKIQLTPAVAGGNSTISIGSGSANATLGFTNGQANPAATANCLDATKCGFTNAVYGSQFLLLPENLNISPAVANQGWFFRQIPRLNATGGSANIQPDFNIVRHGVSVSAARYDTGPGYSFGTMIEAVLTRASGTRTYAITNGYDGYFDQWGFLWNNIGLTSFPTNTISSGSASGQPNPTIHMEQGASVPWFWAMSHAASISTRYKQYILEPSFNSPDYGPLVDCAARTSSYGKLLLCLNISDGPQTVAFNLSPYLQGGQQIIQQVVNDHSIGASTILSAGTASATVTLQPEDAVFFVFPVNFALELQQPAIAARLADVTNATKIVVRFAYDRYYLDSANGSTYDCGTGACTPAWDRNIGTLFYRLIYLDSNSKVLATSDVQSF